MRARTPKPACPRLFEAEAVRDGRLGGAELTRFQTHLGVCAICAREVEALDALGDALREPNVSTKFDELQVRRERSRLLAAFDSSLMPAARTGAAKGWIAIAATLSAFGAFALLAWRAHRVPAPAAVMTPVENVSVHAESSAKWSRSLEGQLERIVLESGTLAIHVDHDAAPRKLLVVLPDGELEDIGTTFSVTAFAGHTTQVSVQDGRVVLRLSDSPPRSLGAGDAWTLVSASPVIVTASAEARPLPSPPTPPPTPRVKPARATAPSANAAHFASGPDPSADFRAAMSALESADHARAASLFAAFVVEHPSDSRAEDAAYLRVIALQRARDFSSLKEAAAAYLLRYPRGFRRAEVEPLAH